MEERMPHEIVDNLELDRVKGEVAQILPSLAKQGEDKPDIVTKDFDIEIETGLKHDLKELEKKLANSTKKTYVVVPNETEKGRYEKMDSM